MEEMISAPCSFRAAFPSEHPLKNESMKQCIRREKANPRSTKVPSSYGFVLRQSPRPRHLPEGNKISERYFFGFVEKPTPLRASLHNKAEIQHFSGSSVILGSPQELRREPGVADNMARQQAAQAFKRARNFEHKAEHKKRRPGNNPQGKSKKRKRQ